jgi:hypothetical protein
MHRDVNLQARHLAARFVAQSRRQLFDPTRMGVADHHLGALVEEAARNRLPDAFTRGCRDYRYLPFQPSHG